MMKIRINKSDGDLSLLQEEIVKLIYDWAHNQRKPIPHRYIIKELRERGVLEVTSKAAIRVLIKKGYIRRAVVPSNKAFYVLLKSI